MQPSRMKEPEPENFGAVSRRKFFKSLGTVAATAATAQVQSVAAELEKANAEQVVGPGAVAVTLKVNGEKLKLTLEPRVTLLDALRNYSSLTGSKEGCDRGTCGACTVLIDDVPVYSCMKLAIEAQGHAITTIEGLAKNGNLTKVQQAFLERDALMCGYCTPGFVMSITALLKKNFHPTADEVRHACAGNICRCGTYPRSMEAAVLVKEGERIVQYYGEELAAVAGTSKQACLDALRLIEVKAEEHPFVVREEDAMKEGAPKVWEDSQSNVSKPKTTEKGEV